MHRAHHVDVERLAGLGIAFPHEGLRRQVKDNIRRGRVERGMEGRRVTKIGSMVRDEQVANTGSSKIAGRRGRRQRVTGHPGPQSVQPDRQPRAFEARMSRNEHGAAGKNLGERRLHCQSFHGTLVIRSRST